MPTIAAPLPRNSSAEQGVYRGWTNLSLAALAMVATLPGRTQGLGLITEPMLADLSLDRVTYATLNLWATLAGALFCLPCGRLVDRFGSRPALAAVVVALGITVVAMTGVAGVAALGVAITLTRGFGQSALSVVSLALVGKWFGRRLNYAMGVYSLLVGLGFILAFPSAGAAVMRFGWRGAWAGVGWFLLLAVAPLAWWLVRNGPTEPAIEFEIHPPAADAAGQFQLTLAQALRTASFWVFALASSLFGLVYSGIALFNQSILEQRGFGAEVYHKVLVVSTLLGLAANFGGGWLATRWPIQRLMGLGMAVLATALVYLRVVQTEAQVLAYGVVMGLAGGIITVVFFSVWGGVYGQTHLGKIQGCAQMMTVVASAVGPLLLAETLQRTGSYHSIFYGLAAVTAVLGIASWLVRLPGPQTELREV